MAKIALAIAGAVVGFLATGFNPMGAVEGASLGLAIGGALFRPQIPGMMPLQDRQVSSSADGAPIPFGYGRGRFGGQVIWSPGIEYHTVGTSAKGAGQPTGLGYFYLASFAAAFGEGPATIERVWGDSKLIYAGGAAFGSFSPWNEITPYNPDDLVSYQFLPTGRTDDVTAIFQCTIANTGIKPAGDSLHWELTSYAYWDPLIEYQPGNQVAYPPKNGQLYAPTTGQIYTCVNPNTNVTPAPAGDWNTMTEYYPAPALYTGKRGDTTQLPDPTIQANNGVNATPAFRGLCYGVWENMPLATFGNRVPNLRAQVNFYKVRNIL